MNRGNIYTGITNIDGVQNIRQATTNTWVGATDTRADKQGPRVKPGPRSIGIVTILAEEATPVIDVFGLKPEPDTSNGQEFYTGSVDAAHGPVDLVATRTLAKGQRSVSSTLDKLRDRSHPGIFILLGIGGGIHPDIAKGDVVIATRVVYYDMREVRPGVVHHRGEEHQADAAMTHAVNSFFTDCRGEPADLGGFRAVSGIIGSGEASLRDPEAEIREYLARYNQKVLAVDMEAGGFTQWCHETGNRRWLVIRGISDHATRVRKPSDRNAAALNAVHALRNLIPYLRTDGN